MFILAASVFVFLWLQSDFVPTHRDVFGTKNLNYWSGMTDGFFNFWTPVFFGLTIAGCVIAAVTLRRSRRAIVWVGLILNLIGFLALITLAVTSRDYPRRDSYLFPYITRTLTTAPRK
jgi:hypothetical protein